MENTLDGKVALVTGAARRIGAAIASQLHDSGARVAIHYRGSSRDAEALAQKLNTEREHSASTFQADLLDIGATTKLSTMSLLGVVASTFLSITRQHSTRRPLAKSLNNIGTTSLAAI